VDFISDFSPRYQRELRCATCVWFPIPCRAAKAAERINYNYRQAPHEQGAWMRMRRAPHGF